jgi:hypothetical protein
MCSALGVSARDRAVAGAALQRQDLRDARRCQADRRTRRRIGFLRRRLTLAHGMSIC